MMGRMEKSIRVKKEEEEQAQRRTDTVFKSKKMFVEVYGWYGTIAIVLAYILVSFSILQPADIRYQLLNATGALGVVLISFYKQAYQPAILNILWATIAFIAIVKIVF